MHGWETTAAGRPVVSQPGPSLWKSRGGEGGFVWFDNCLGTTIPISAEEERREVGGRRREKWEET